MDTVYCLVMLNIRTYALYERSGRVKLFLWTISLTVLGVGCVSNGIGSSFYLSSCSRGLQVANIFQPFRSAGRTSGNWVQHSTIGDSVSSFEIVF